MNETIDKDLKRAAVSLADTLDYDRAARALNISIDELKAKVSTLQDKLCVHIFEPGIAVPHLTEEGRFLIEVFRECKFEH